MRDHRSDPGYGYSGFGYGQYQENPAGYGYPFSPQQPATVCDSDGDDCTSTDDTAPVEDFAVLAQSRLSDDREHRAFVNLGDRFGALRTLRLDASGGMYLYEVGIEFLDGRRTMAVFPKTMLDGRNASITIDLGAPSVIRRVIVYGRNMSWQSRFSISAI